MAGSQKQSILAAAGIPERRVRYLLVYGSSAHRLTRARDVDALLVADQVAPRYISQPLRPSVLNLHVVNERHVRDDLLRDRYGWVLLTKYLADYRLLCGSQRTVAIHKAMAYLRLVGQWAADTGMKSQKDFDFVLPAVTDVLSRWNPQFAHYVSTGRIDLTEYRRYVENELCRRPEVRQMFRRHRGQFTLRASCRLVRKADLRAVLVRYWSFYIAYKASSALYLGSQVERLLKAKGV